MPMIADRVLETATTTGTGDFTTLGAVANYVTFNTAVGLSLQFYYTIRHQSASEWETGIGYLSGTTTLVREIVKESSNSGAAVNFSAGTKDVFITVIADGFMDIGQAYAMMSGTALP